MYPTSDSWIRIDMVDRWMIFSYPDSIQEDQFYLKPCSKNLGLGNYAYSDKMTFSKVLLVSRSLVSESTSFGPSGLLKAT